MRALTWFPLVCLLACGACTPAVSSWDPFAVDPEPMELPEGLDERDPYAFFNHGQQILERSPGRAADAFYWASRLDPSWASPLFARRMALLMAEPHIFGQYVEGNRRIMGSPGAQRLDSLYLRALTMNPFPQRREEARALRALFTYQVRQYLLRRSKGAPPDDATLGYMIEDYLARADAPTRAWIAYSEGRYGAAAEQYRKAVSRDEDNPRLRADLARSLFMIGRYDEAEAEMDRAVALLEERDADELVRVYESRALFEHSVGMIRETVSDPDGARDRYAAALQEDLAYYPAHMRLAGLALEAHDTATALNEMALAVEIRPDDAAVRYQHGRMLSAAGRFEEAEAELRAAIELEPLFAAPYRALALALEAQDRSADAANEHARFIERAHPRAPGVAESREWLDRVHAGGTP